jgi:hypothetical protein
MSKKKNANAVAMAKLRHKSLTSEQRSEIARKAAKAKWAKVGDDPVARQKATEAANEARRKTKENKGPETIS